MNNRVLHLNEKDALPLLRLLDGLHRLLADEQLTPEQCDVLAGGRALAAMEGAGRQARLAAEVAAARGLLRQSLEGYDAAAVIKRADPPDGAPGTGG